MQTTLTVSHIPEYIFFINRIARKLKVVIINYSRYKRGTRNCSARHSVLAELDKPVKGVPTSGVVKVSFRDYSG